MYPPGTRGAEPDGSDVAAVWADRQRLGWDAKLCHMGHGAILSGPAYSATTPWRASSSIARSASSDPSQNHSSAEAIAAGGVLGRSGEPARETAAGQFAVKARTVVPSVDSHESRQMAQIFRRELVTGYVGA